MRCSSVLSSTRPLLIAYLLNIAAGALVVYAQTLAGADAINPGITIPAFKRSFAWSMPKVDSAPTFPKNLTIESFGYSLAPVEPGFQFSPAYTAAFFNTQGLECPGCVMGPVTRAKFTLPPFGAKATLKLWHDRVELFSGSGALEAWKPDGTFEPRGHSLFSSSYGDAWLAQVEAGGRIALDRSQHVWVGATGRHLRNLGPGLREWNTYSGNATFVFGQQQFRCARVPHNRRVLDRNIPVVGGMRSSSTYCTAIVTWPKLA
jgi:hypothetical protein